MRLRVTAPARLHFGLLQIDPSRPHCFGGLGLMLQSPRLEVTCESQISELLMSCPTGSMTLQDLRDTFRPKIVQAVKLASEYLGLDYLADVMISLESIPKLHSGLGTGTQLACAIATAIVATQYPNLQSGAASNLWSAIANNASSGHAELARASGRGKRSHIGLEGFLQGGWIFDEGGNDSASGNRLVSRIDFPQDWQILLFLNDALQGLSGEKEQASFDRSQSIPTNIPDRMYALAAEKIMPALRQADFDSFAPAIRQYNVLAGELFMHHEPSAITRDYFQHMDKILQSRGITAFGQTSWGPTMWAIAPKSQDNLARLQADFRQNGLADVRVLPTQVSHNGATLDIISENE